MDRLCFGALLTALAVPASGQSHVIPAGFNYDKTVGASALQAGISGVPATTGAYSRAQVVFDSAQLPFQTAMISRIELRRDAVFVQNYASAPRKFTVRLGYTGSSPMQLPQAFAAVEGGTPPAVVFSGTIVLPAEAFPGTALPPWSVVVDLAAPWPFDATKGNLIVDVESDGTTTDPWNADAHWSYRDGQAGTEQLVVKGCSGSNGLEFRLLRDIYQAATNRKMTIVAVNIPPSVPLVAGLVGHRLAQPVLATGTPDCFVALDPFCSGMASSFNEGGPGMCAMMQYDFPDNPFLIGGQFTVQYYYADPAANPLGAVSSEAVEFTLGRGPSQAYAVQTNTANYPGLANGMQTGAEYGPILRVSGNMQ